MHHTEWRCGRRTYLRSERRTKLLLHLGQMCAALSAITRPRMRARQVDSVPQRRTDVLKVLEYNMRPASVSLRMKNTTATVIYCRSSHLFRTDKESAYRECKYSSAEWRDRSGRDASCQLGLLSPLGQEIGPNPPPQDRQHHQGAAPTPPVPGQHGCGNFRSSFTEPQPPSFARKRKCMLPKASSSTVFGTNRKFVRSTQSTPRPRSQ